jgi:large subunit ribosomal protein L20
MRVKRGVARRAKHNSILKKAKGFSGRRKSVYKLAKQAVIKAGQYAYRDRRVKKRMFRAVWIQKINAAARDLGLSYSEFINKLKVAGVDVNRKMLADLAENEPKAFKAIVKKINK